MQTNLFYQLIIYLFVLCVTPGANTILSFANASEYGIKKGISLNIGMTAGILVVDIISFFLLSFFSKILPSLNLFLQVFGIVYLVFLGITLWRKNGINTDKENKGGFKFGFLLQIVNVKLIMLSVTAISMFILPMEISSSAHFMVSLLIPLMCFLCQMIWAFAGSVLMSVYKKHGKLMNIIFAFSLFAFAVNNLYKLIISVV